MSNRVAIYFTILTFFIAGVFSAGLVILGRFGFAVQSTDNIWINIPFVIYICSPAISSYIVLKKQRIIGSFREWLGNVFSIKGKPSHYAFVFAGIIIYFAIQVYIADSVQEIGISTMLMFLLFMPATLLLGGLEEAGWVYILQPKLDSKYGFALSSLCMGIIWIVWHIPLFFIVGTTHYEGGFPLFWLFAFSNIFGRFYYTAIHRVSGNVFLSILFHTMWNAGYNSFAFERTWQGYFIGFFVLFVISVVAVVRVRKQD